MEKVSLLYFYYYGNNQRHKKEKGNLMGAIDKFLLRESRFRQRQEQSHRPYVNLRIVVD